MAEYKCNVCGSPIQADNNATAVTCTYCGAQQQINRCNPWESDANTTETENITIHEIIKQGESPKIKDLQKQSNENLLFAIISFFVFWPVSIYFFYKMYQINEEIKKLK